MAKIPDRPDITGTVTASESCLLVLNAGSSSVKFALFSADGIPTRRLSGAVDGIGHIQGRFHAVDATGRTWADEPRSVANQEDANEILLSAVERSRAGGAIVAVGHRIVHGGPGCDCPEYVCGATYVERPRWQVLFSDDSSRRNGAVICPACQRGLGPLASMKSAMRGADQSDAL